MNNSFNSNKLLLIVFFTISLLLAYICFIDVVQGQSSEPPAAKPPPEIDESQAPDRTMTSPVEKVENVTNKLLQSFMKTNGTAYQVVTVPYILGTYFNKTGVINPEIICGNISTDNNKVKINVINCDNVFVFLNVDVKKINSTTFNNRFPDLIIFNNLFYQFTFLPEIIQTVLKSDKFYCSQLFTKQFDMTLSNCDEFSIFFKRK